MLPLVLPAGPFLKSVIAFLESLLLILIFAGSNYRTIFAFREIRKNQNRPKKKGLMSNDIEQIGRVALFCDIMKDV